MRREPTKAEADFWQLLRVLNKDGAHFRRQVAIDDYVFDFGDYSPRVLIEVDGGAHDQLEQQQFDAVKARHAEQQGFRLMRVRNEEIARDFARLSDRVRAFHDGARSSKPLTPNPSPPGGGEV